MGRAVCGALLATSIASAAAAAPDKPADGAATASCLSGPKGAAPQGERWYYRVERGTKRKCWYTRAASPSNVATKITAPEPVAAADDTPPPAPAPLQPAVANARAEAPSPFPSPSTFPAPQPDASAMTADPSRTLADRLADSPDAGRATQAVPQSAALPAAKAASDAPQTSLWMLLIVIGGALALGGGGFAIFTWLTHPRRIARSQTHWPAAPDKTDNDTPPLAADAEEAPTQWDGPPMSWVRIAREEAEKRGEDIENLLSRRPRPA